MACTDLSGADQDLELDHGDDGHDDVDEIHQAVNDGADLDELGTLGLVLVRGIVLERSDVSKDEEKDGSDTEEGVDAREDPLEDELVGESGLTSTVTLMSAMIEVNMSLMLLPLGDGALGRHQQRSEAGAHEDDAGDRDVLLALVDLKDRAGNLEHDICEEQHPGTPVATALPHLHDPQDEDGKEQKNVDRGIDLCNIVVDLAGASKARRGGSGRGAGVGTGRGGRGGGGGWVFDVRHLA